MKKLLSGLLIFGIFSTAVLAENKICNNEEVDQENSSWIPLEADSDYFFTDDTSDRHQKFSVIVELWRESRAPSFMLSFNFETLLRENFGKVDPSDYKKYAAYDNAEDFVAESSYEELDNFVDELNEIIEQKHANARDSELYLKEFSTRDIIYSYQENISVSHFADSVICLKKL